MGGPYSDSPVIVLPDDPELRARLEAKLKEYQGRINPYQPPETQTDVFCKIAVLEKLLEDGSIETYPLTYEVQKELGYRFSARSYDNACAVIASYVEDGGSVVQSGTGLPPAE